MVLGFDGGGTSTRACLMDESGKVLGSAKAGPSSVDTVDAETTAASIAEAYSAAFSQAKNAVGNDAAIVVEAAVAGIGGIVSASDAALVSGIIAKLPGVSESATIEAVNDMKIALAGGTEMKPGIACIIGTGSVAYGRNAEGREHKTGGWGWKEGDPGSSFELGVNAIREMVRAYDFRKGPSRIASDTFRALRLTTIDDITTRLYQEDMSRTEIAALAPLVTAAANDGDEAALAIVELATDGLALMINTVFDRLFQLPSDFALPAASTDRGGEVLVATIGSLGNSPGVFREKLGAKLLSHSPRLNMISPRREPVEGAALWALHLLRFGKF